MTIEGANRLLISSLSEIYDEREAASISSMVMERLTGMTKSLRVLNKTDVFTTGQEELLNGYLADLLKSRPVQYVLEEAWFGSIPFFVNEHVLIPRPETEELVNWLLDDYNPAMENISVLDIGTGSGCIPVFLKKKRRGFNVLALDISEAALEVAGKNSRTHDTPIDFFKCDVLDLQQRENIPRVDILISNPPYIPQRQKQVLDKHVRDFEPGLALFVTDDDPILFYKVIGSIAKNKLNPGGTVYLEIHHDYAHQVMHWYEENRFKLELKKDLSGNNRMIKAVVL